MTFESSQVKAPPLSGRRMMPPTPLQNSYSSFEGEQVHFEVEDQIGVRVTERLLRERSSTWKKVKV